MSTDEQKADVVERYDALAASDGDLVYPIMELHPQGDWVQFAHYQATITALQERIKELEGALMPMLQRFELYAGENDVHAGYHDKALLELARSALKDSGNGSEVAR